MKLRKARCANCKKRPHARGQAWCKKCIQAARQQAAWMRHFVDETFRTKLTWGTSCWCGRLSAKQSVPGSTPGCPSANPEVVVEVILWEYVARRVPVRGVGIRFTACSSTDKSNRPLSDLSGFDSRQADMGSQYCGICGESMKRFIVDGKETWKCMNIKAHAARQARIARTGGKRKGAGRKKKKK